MSDGQIDQFVKARWRAIGLSQSELAEVLGAARASSQDFGRQRSEASRLRQIAEALEVPAGLLSNRLDGKGPDDAATNPAMQSLLDLRLLRAFRELQDSDTKRMLVHLAEQIVKCRSNGGGEAG